MGLPKPLALIIKSSRLALEADVKKSKTVDTQKIVQKKEELQKVNNEIFRLLDSVFFKIKEESTSSIVFYSHFLEGVRK